jgi:serine/threonine protein phosphatase PrpC
LFAKNDVIICSYIANIYLIDQRSSSKYRQSVNTLGGFSMFGETSPASDLVAERRYEDDNIPAAITDVGCEREINEDRYAVIDSSVGRSWIVCDGMGGAMGGELAAQLAIDAVRRALESKIYESPTEALQSAIEEANRVIVLRRQNPSFGAMGTTLVAGIVCDSEIVIAHAGDSRAYVVRDNNLQQLTEDHTYVQDLVNRGAITVEEAMVHPQSHVLTRCLGADPRIQLDVNNFWLWDLKEGETQDKLVLCSDGLYSMVADEEIAGIVSSHSPQEACVQLVELAKARGGYDNITVTVLPLGGRLKEEMPAGVEKKQQKKLAKPVKKTKKKRKLTVGQKVVVLMVLGLVGSLLAALFVLFGMT